MSAEELLPCPFCGETANALQSGRVESYGDWIAGCDNEQCMAQPEVLAATKIKAIAAWNRRTPPAMSADHIGEASNMVAPVAALSSKPVDDTGEANSSVKFHVEAVAWRYRYPNDPTWQLTLDCKQAHDKTGEVQPLFTHPAPIKPSGDTGELRERVAQIIEAAIERHNPVNSLRHTMSDADEILDLIQSERGGA